MNSLNRAFKGFIIVLGLLIFGALVVNAQDCNCELPSRNCAVPITNLNGQGYVVDGVAGGLTFEPSASASDGVADPFPESWIDSGIDQVTEDTAILVIDSFGEAPGQLPGSYLMPSAMAADDEELGLAYLLGDFTHGALVFNHINALLLGALGGSALVDVNDDRVEWTTSSGARLVVVKVHALAYGAASETTGATPTDILTPIITEAIFNQQADGFERFVLNMSFAILPCEVANGYNAARNANPALLFDQYVASVGDASTSFFEQFITPVHSLTQPDPLFRLIGLCGIPETTARGDRYAVEREAVEAVEGEFDAPFASAELGFRPPCDPGQPNLTFVGAAGNSRLPYPFFPAAYANVTSVSAASADLSGVPSSSYSNYNADERLAGGWFPLIAFTTDNPTQLQPTPGRRPLYYRGTSFAAPLESVCVALAIENSAACESVEPS